MRASIPSHPYRMVWPMFLCVLALVLGGCGTSIPSGGDTNASPASWRWQNPLPQGNDLNSVWAYSPSEVYAVGDAGTLLHYDGSAWQRVPVDTDANLLAVWGAYPTNLFAVGDRGTILHFDGTAWEHMDSPTTESLRAVWGSSPSDIYAVGGWLIDGVILHYDGSRWSVMQEFSETLRGVWGAGPTDVYAVGGSGFVLHYDGLRWSEVDIGRVFNGLRCVWGTGASDVFVVGSVGLVLHFDGLSWSRIETETSAHLDAIWGYDSTHVFAVSDVIHYYDGELWTVLPDVDTQGLLGICGTSDDNILTVGKSGGILAYDGVQWVRMDHGTREDLLAVWGSDAQDVFAAGKEGAVLHYDGHRWTGMPSPTTASLNDLWGSDGNTVFAVGSNGAMIHYDGTTWTEVDSGTTEDLNSIWGSGFADIFAAGDNGAMIHYDGVKWEPMSIGRGEDIVVVWGTGPENVYALTSQEFVWSPIVGDVDQLGGVLHYDGAEWSVALSSVTESSTANGRQYRDMWGSSPDDMMIIGRYRGRSGPDIAGTIVWTFDGLTWSEGSPMGREAQAVGFVDAIAGESPENIIGVGGMGRFVQYDGVEWQEIEAGTKRWMTDVWAASSMEVFAVGEGGTVLYYGPSD